MIDPEDLPPFMREEIEAASNVEDEAKMQELDASIAEFAEKLLEAMSTPIEEGTEPSAWSCLLRMELPDADAKAAD